MDGVLRVMVSGLEEELKARLSGSKVYAANKSPSSTNPPIQTIPMQSSGNATLSGTNQAGVTLPVTSQGGTAELPSSLPVLKQGMDVGFVVRGSKRVVQWLARKVRRGKEQT